MENHGKEWKEMMSKKMKGNRNGAGNKGNHPSPETVVKLKSSHLGKPRGGNPDNWKHTEATKSKISKANKGKPGFWKGKHQTVETRQKIREYVVAHPNKQFCDTGIELKIEAELIKRNIVFQKQVPLCKIARVDFYLPEYHIVIQADGDYWHNKPGVQERDARQNAVLTFNGFNVYRFWEHEINKSVEECIDSIKLIN